MSLQRLQIGDVVEVRTTIEAGYEGITRNERKLFRTELETPKIGQVVGLKRLYLGKYNSGNFDDQAYLQVERGVTVWLVRFGMLNRPVCVQDEDLVLRYKMPKLFRFKLPLLDAKRTPWSEEYKKEQREIMKNAPRDEKGRWKKG